MNAVRRLAMAVRYASLHRCTTTSCGTTLPLAVRHTHRKGMSFFEGRFKSACSWRPLLESLAHQQPTATTPTAPLGTQSQCGKPGGASAASREASSSTFASRKGAWIGRYKRYPSSGFCLCDRLMKLNDSVSASKILSVHQKCDSVQILVESPCYWCAIAFTIKCYKFLLMKKLASFADHILVYLPFPCFLRLFEYAYLELCLSISLSLI